jgi:hypothetical protein
MPWPELKLFLWSNMTVELWDPFTDGSWLRFWPFALPVLLFAVFVLWNELTPGTRGRAAIRAAVWLFLPWMLWTHLGAVRSIFVHSAAETARLYRPENIVMQTYSWDLLRLPPYYSLGAVDPRLETRLWRQDKSRTLLIDPDLIAREMEKSDAERLVPRATQDATYRQWIYLAPKVELAPGEHKLLRFDFKGSAPSGWLIVRGQNIYREYILPSSGLERSFGSGPLNSHTLSLWNSGSEPETLELVLKRDGPAAMADVRAGDIPDVVVSHYDPSRAPVEVKSLSPLVLRVRAPEAGMLELFRSYYPGYRVSLNGVPVRAISSRDGLIALPVPAGESEVAVRFRGTPTLRAMFWYGLAAWTWVALAAGFRLVRAAGKDSHSGLRAVPIA